MTSQNNLKKARDQIVEAILTIPIRNRFSSKIIQNLLRWTQSWPDSLSRYSSTFTVLKTDGSIDA